MKQPTQIYLTILQQYCTNMCFEKKTFKNSYTKAPEAFKASFLEVIRYTESYLYNRRV